MDFPALKIESKQQHGRKRKSAEMESDDISTGIDVKFDKALFLDSEKTGDVTATDTKDETKAAPAKNDGDVDMDTDSNAALPTDIEDDDPIISAPGKNRAKTSPPRPPVSPITSPVSPPKPPSIAPTSPSGPAKVPDPEVRACNCLNAKRFPYRKGITGFGRDNTTQCTVRQDVAPCKLDHKHKLGLWCIKQHLVRDWARARGLSGPAYESNPPDVKDQLWEMERNTTTWVFCGEKCLAMAIRKKLPEDQIKLFKRVRFFERDDKQNGLQYSRETYLTGLQDPGPKQLIYRNWGISEIEYEGVKVFVKDLYLED